jgi:dynein heavy chain, axonemal
MKSCETIDECTISGLYIAPCYYSSFRTDSFIVAIELKTGSMPSEHWIKRATALIMNLDS